MNTGTKLSHSISDVAVMVQRCMAHSFRSVDTIITVIAMPVMLMLLFVYVFGGAIDTGRASGSYVNYMLPGILLMAIGSGVAYAAVRLHSDVAGGIFERFHSMPIARSSLLWGHVLTSVASCAVSLVVIMGVALMMGFRSSAGIGAWLVVIGFLLLFTLATTWLAVVSGLAAKSAEGAGVFAYPLLFLPFISSAFVPTESMPGPVRAFAEHQPVTSIVETIRLLLMNEPVGNSVWIALAWCLALLVATYLFAIRTYRRMTSG